MNSPNIRITISGGCGSGKTGISLALARLLREHGVEVGLHLSVLDGAAPVTQPEVDKKLEHIVRAGGKVVIENVTTRRRAEPLAGWNPHEIVRVE